MTPFQVFAACEPLLFFWLYFLLFRALSDRVRALSPVKNMTIALIISLLWIPFFLNNYTYESTLFVETIPVIIVGWPFFKKLFRPRITLAWSLIIIVVGLVSQVIAVSCGEFHYPDADEQLFFLGLVKHLPLIGGVLDNTIPAFGDMPNGEIIWYFLYCVKILCECCIFIEFFSSTKFNRSMPALGKAWLALIIAMVAAIAGLYGTFIIQRITGPDGFRLPGMGTLVLAAFGILLFCYIRYQGIRRLFTYPVISLLTIIMTIQMGIWEFIHVAVLDHWKYTRDRGLGSVHDFFAVSTYPSADGAGLYLGIEEYAGYIALYPTILVFMILGMYLLKRDFLQPGSRIRAYIQSNRGEKINSPDSTG